MYKTANKNGWSGRTIVGRCTARNLGPGGRQSPPSPAPDNRGARMREPLVVIRHHPQIYFV